VPRPSRWFPSCRARSMAGDACIFGAVASFPTTVPSRPSPVGQVRRRKLARSPGHASWDGTPETPFADRLDRRRTGGSERSAVTCHDPPANRMADRGDVISVNPTHLIRSRVEARSRSRAARSERSRRSRGDSYAAIFGDPLGERGPGPHLPAGSESSGPGGSGDSRLQPGRPDSSRQGN